MEQIVPESWNTSRRINHNHMAAVGLLYHDVKSAANQENKALVSIARTCTRTVKKLSRYKRCSHHPLRIYSRNYVYAAPKWISFSRCHNFRSGIFVVRSFDCAILRHACMGCERAWTHPVYIYGDRFLWRKDGQAAVFPVNYVSRYFFSMIVCYLYDAGVWGAPHSFSVVS